MWVFPRIRARYKKRPNQQTFEVQVPSYPLSIVVHTQRLEDVGVAFHPIPMQHKKHH